jgi:(4-(4-[2-(gamma-L-glutamylamino)ethyl]phenoxymethyl)furan-2-yl)methanamine synthase
LHGQWVDAAAAIHEPMSVAASNWHGLATWVSREWPGSRGLVVDSGSTTTDLIPYDTTGVLARGRTDLQRLRAGELVYLGGRRTALAMLSPEIDLSGARLRVPAELFATTLDLGLLTGVLAEDPHDFDTANGRPATVAESLHRVARQLCADLDEVTPATAREAADQWWTEARRAVSDALTLGARPLPGLATGQSGEAITYDTVVTGGSGAWLVEPVLDVHPLTRSARRVSLGTVLPAGCSEAACAYALARLAESGPECSGIANV